MKHPVKRTSKLPGFEAVFDRDSRQAQLRLRKLTVRAVVMYRRSAQRDWSCPLPLFGNAAKLLICVSYANLRFAAFALDGGGRFLGSVLAVAVQEQGRG
jgi:hypothetical protein